MSKKSGSCGCKQIEKEILDRFLQGNKYPTNLMYDIYGPLYFLH
ncbi:hypothetical protein THF1C08_50231 [Vibrio jasicida]|uniref:Uncharacterized protein n=1 Tax=Vibrio jasicida TaxID=766224 RepID=A0AAU9QTB3_9VIBR|nr:hypothetical protein THF1C08_50231 [Vibrio jasicida]CAH1601583.1 hypothetical protein THF1A12_50115 [Vibrio jasicida]